MPAPLLGRRILDLGALCGQLPHNLAASMAAKLCAAYGAEVVRPSAVSAIGAASETLAGAEPRLPDGGSALDKFLNEGKSLEGTGAFDAAIGDSAALARFAASAPIKVRLSIYGAGEDPPISELALGALAGLLDVVGDADGPPTRLAGHQLAYAAGLAACTGLLAALHAGGEEIVDISLFDVAAWLNWKAAAGMLIKGESLKRGNARNFWRIMPATDGHVALVYQEKNWPELRDMVGDIRLREERFATFKGRSENFGALTAILTPWFMARSRAEITGEAQSRRIPIGPVLRPDELPGDPHYQARSAFDPGGMPRLPLLWDGARIDEGDARAG